MNRILISESEIQADGTVRLDDWRAAHILKVLRVTPGECLATGTQDGLAGVSRLLAVHDGAVTLLPEHTVAAPEPWFDLLLAMPRPKVLKRLLPQLAAMGVGRLVLLNASKVEKCYFSSQWLEPAHYEPLLIEGLMQAGTTQLPLVMAAPRFKPFIEDELERLFPHSLRLIAHPGEPALPRLASPYDRPLLAVGPEGGWTGYERERLREHGFADFSLGQRTLRTDTACIALVAALASALQAG